MNGPFERFPYTNFHDLNMDWIIKIAKDFLDQYSNIQDTITDGLNDIEEKATEIQGLLDQWYETHSEDIASALADALDDIGEALTDAERDFNAAAEEKTEACLQSIPDDYTTLYNESMANAQVIAASTDFNDLDDSGYYSLSATTATAQTYVHDPVPAGNVAYMVTMVVGTVIYQIIFDITFGQVYSRSKISGSWSDWVRIDKFTNMSTIAANTDFNTLKQTGYYNLAGSSVTAGTYVNNPITPGNYGIVMAFEIASNIQHQVAVDTLACKIYSRYCVNNTWGSWTDGVDFRVRSSGLAANTNFNSLTESGYYALSGSDATSATYVNNPVPTGHYAVLVAYKVSVNVVHQIIHDLVDGSLYSRWKVSNNFGSWQRLNGLEDNISVSYASSSAEKLTANTGINLKIMTYNVAQYNNDSETQLPANKELNLKKLIMEVNADIVGTQEDKENCSTGKNSHNYLWQPSYPFKSGTGGPCIYTRDTMTANGIVEYSTGRYIRYATITVNDKTLLVLSTHPSPDTTENRLLEYTELFQWVTGEAQLSNTDCPTWDYCIITGDFNSMTDTDKTNLATLAAANDFTMANGGYLGWLQTNIRYPAIDNILVSKDITINSIKTYNSWFNDLYSDHVPMVIEVTLN